MIDPTICAYIFSAFSVAIVIFQFALALGVPWGELAMGGKFHGRFPPYMRVAALVQIVLYVFIMLVVLTRSELVFNQYFESSKFAIWFVVVLFAVGTILNIITPSKKERKLWAPVSIVLLACSVIVAIS